MRFFSELAAQIDVLRDALGDDLEGSTAPEAMLALSDDTVLRVIDAASALVKVGDSLRIVAAGVAAARSARDRGHSGLAQRKGHRSPVSLMQEITGGTRADAVRQVRLGEALLMGVSSTALATPDPVTGRPEPVAERRDPATAPPSPWHAPLSHALMTGRITAAQQDAIMRGLGEPPGVETTEGVAEEGVDDVRDAAAEVWRLAAAQLVDEAPHVTVEALGASARAIRDHLDPEGAARRFDERFSARSFRMWRDADGIQRASISFDDEMAAWVRSIVDAALRPRRGGPRFVDPAEQAQADELVADPRTNDQLTYDLLMDVLRAGALAEAKEVYGARQAGVRVVLTARALHVVGAVADGIEATAADGTGAADGIETDERRRCCADAPHGADAVGHLDDDGSTLPAWLVDRHACETGTVTCITDRTGNPLYLGREERLFSARQRLTLALRDGGCRWRGCDRPASYCESHHIDHYAQDEGRTDIDRGILLCRYHHMQLHHGGWRITRDGLGDFVLHPPDSGGPIPLPRKLQLQYAWAGISPPRRRFRLAG